MKRDRTATKTRKWDLSSQLRRLGRISLKPLSEPCLLDGSKQNHRWKAILHKEMKETARKMVMGDAQ